MARRGYSSTPTYSSRRPRTKIYDSNYSMGEAAYRSAIDDLDRKQYGRVRREEAPAPPAEERVSPPRRPRPLSMSEIEANWDGPGPAPRLEEAEPAGIDELLERIKAARSRATQNEQSFDSAYTLRREDVKRRFAEKMLDTVGINGEEERRPLRLHSAAMEDPKWPAIVEQGDTASELAARSRLRQTRARLADIDAEMSDMEQRGLARERRAAAVRQLLSSSDEQASSVRLASKKITVTEQRTTSAY